MKLLNSYDSCVTALAWFRIRGQNSRRLVCSQPHLSIFKRYIVGQASLFLLRRFSQWRGGPFRICASWVIECVKQEVCAKIYMLQNSEGPCPISLWFQYAALRSRASCVYKDSPPVRTAPFNSLPLKTLDTGGGQFFSFIIID